MKPIEKMTFSELVEWAEGHILKELIRGDFHGAVFTVCEVTTRWHEHQEKIEKKRK